MKSYVKFLMLIFLTSFLSCNKLTDEITSQDYANLNTETLATKMSQSKNFAELTKRIFNNQERIHNELENLTKEQQEERSKKINAMLDGKTNEIDDGLLFSEDFSIYSQRFTQYLDAFKKEFNNVENKLAIEKAFGIIRGTKTIINGRVEDNCNAQYGGCTDVATAGYTDRVYGGHASGGGSYGDVGFCSYMAGLAYDRAIAQCGYNLTVCQYL